ncbi:GDP-L-fucose synthase family protein [Candidatus Pelagibacter sp. HIMB1517]|uniref:GDP-L-fucose synthase family protein n=1 Tax=Candidatus Pelagibacter sp. HIMB1517 TaxID=3413341 RepID=UPI003F869A8F
MKNKNKKILVTGHKGLVGSSVLRILKKRGYKNIITATRSSLDLRDSIKVEKFFRKHKPNAVINCAATVGGIYANNTLRAKFIYDNLSIQTNIINSSFQNNIKDLIFLGSSCIYPRDCKQPIKEKYLLTGPLEKTNEPYAIAKIAGVKMCEAYNDQYNTNYKCLMPTNAFGPNDNYDPNLSHFIPAFIARLHAAKIRKEKIFKVWGSGNPLREVIYVDDIADACIFFLHKKTKDSLINIGSGIEMKIKDFAKFMIKELKLNLNLKYDSSKPDGTPRKLLDTSLAKSYGWKSKTTLQKAFWLTYNNYKDNIKKR